jgi:hypothetical protein|tara:strand:+ start:404 stop:712 length:309 start_codon:yes stop_codon:yes gene_type:complete
MTQYTNEVIRVHLMQKAKEWGMSPIMYYYHDGIAETRYQDGTIEELHKGEENPRVYPSDWSDEDYLEQFMRSDVFRRQEKYEEWHSLKVGKDGRLYDSIIQE